MKAERVPLRNVPVHLPVEALRALPKADARRLRSVLNEANSRARARMNAATAAIETYAERRLAKARADAEAILAEAQAEAAAILALLPDYDALARRRTAAGRTALQVVQAVCDAGGYSMTIIRGRRGRSLSADARRVRDKALRAVHAECPGMDFAELGAFFALNADYARQIVREGER